MSFSSSPTIAIFRKEMRGFFSNSTSLLVYALCTTVMSWMFTIYLARFQQMSQQSIFSMRSSPQAMNIHFNVFIQHLSIVNLLLMLMVPVLTMRLFAEEKKMRTYDLLLTSPITSFQIVMGKLFAVLGAILVIMFLALIYPMSMGLFAKLEWAPLFIAAFGIFLLGALYAAGGLFCSAITDSPVSAAIMAVVLNLFIFFIGVGGEISDNPIMRSIFEHISLGTHLSGLVEGTIRTNGLVFFASIIFLFAFLAERMVESSRWR